MSAANQQSNYAIYNAMATIASLVAECYADETSSEPTPDSQSEMFHTIAQICQDNDIGDPGTEVVTLIQHEDSDSALIITISCAFGDKDVMREEYDAQSGDE